MAFLLNGPIRNLSRIWRYSSMPLYEPESVMEHNAWVSWYTMQIIHWVSNHPPQDQIVLVNSKLCYEMAITHDLSECFTGDMIRPVKYSSEAFRKAYHELEVEAEEELLTHLPLEVEQPVRDAWHVEHYEKGRLETRIVKLADLLSVWGKLVEEARVGNNYAKERCRIFLENYTGRLSGDPILGKLYDEIVAEPMAPARLEGFAWDK